MKKSVLSLFLVTALLLTHKLANAQIPNSSFETWTSTPYNDLDNWQSGNQQAIRHMGVVPVSKVSGHTGFGVRMQTMIAGGDTAQAYIANGDPMSGDGGIPCTQQPTAITGYYRYNLPGNDSAIIILLFKHNGSIISSNIFKIKGSGIQNTFAAFSFPISLSSTPDSVIIAAASSNLIDDIGVENGSFLELDGLILAGTSVTILNGNFENWTPMSLDIPGGWQASGEGIAKTSDSYSGNFAISLTTIDQGGGNIGSSGITSGHYANNGPSVGGNPYANMTDTLTGYYKYTTSGADSASISISLSNNGTNIGGTGMFLTGASTYTYFELPIHTGMAPDTMRIDISSSKWPYSIASAGSILYIDNLALKSQTILSVANKERIKLQNISSYPNPAVSILNLTFEKKLNGTSLVIVHDASGKLVREEYLKCNSNHAQLNVADLTPGIYYYEVISGDEHVPGKFTKQ